MKTTAKPARRLLRPKQAAEILNVNPRTLVRWADTGILTVLKIGAAGRHRRYYADEVTDMETTAKPPRLLRPKQAAEMLNVDPRTLARWADTGILTVLKIGAAGKHRRYYADEVEALLEREPGPGSSI